MKNYISNVPANAAPSIVAKAFFDVMTPLLTNFYSRWQDEKAHEKIEDYAKHFIKIVAENIPNVEVLGMSSRPFAVEFKIEDGRVYRMKHTSKTCCYQRIA